MQVRTVSLAAYCKLQLQSPEDKDTQRVGGIANSACIAPVDVNGDGDIELVVGLVGGKLVIYKGLENTAPWATSASSLGSIVAVTTGFLTRPQTSGAAASAGVEVEQGGEHGDGGVRVAQASQLEAGRAEEVGSVAPRGVEVHKEAVRLG